MIRGESKVPPEGSRKRKAERDDHTPAPTKLDSKTSSPLANADASKVLPTGGATTNSTAAASLTALPVGGTDLNAMLTQALSARNGNSSSATAVRASGGMMDGAKSGGGKGDAASGEGARKACALGAGRVESPFEAKASPRTKRVMVTYVSLGCDFANVVVRMFRVLSPKWVGLTSVALTWPRRANFPRARWLAGYNSLLSECTDRSETITAVSGGSQTLPRLGL